MKLFAALICAVINGEVYPLADTPTFTLSWMHSVEKIQWEEDWTLRDKQLFPQAVRVRGSGAGMDPPENAVYHHGYWEYPSPLPPQTTLRLTHSTFTPGYTFCVEKHCERIEEKILLSDRDTVFEIQACPQTTNSRAQTAPAKTQHLITLVQD